jgi:hypothetical protein
LITLAVSYDDVKDVAWKEGLNGYPVGMTLQYHNEHLERPNKIIPKNIGYEKCAETLENLRSIRLKRKSLRVPEKPITRKDEKQWDS